ncbi:MAG TPA: TadE/TadG family type IV pilus assembly protein [Acidimicrobiales bacterium]|nr:TadE/TadG family type IV pilus assembly protein [Acidimicrobiales bacterium]
MISTTIGVFVFLLFLLMAVQVTYNLYATTMVTSAAHDAARRVAGAAAEGDPSALARGEAWVKELLGEYGERNVDDVAVRRIADAVVVRVVARNPSFVPPAFRRPLGLDTIDRSVRVRIEREIEP